LLTGWLLYAGLLNFGFTGVALLAAAVATALVTPYLMFALYEFMAWEGSHFYPL